MDRNKTCQSSMQRVLCGLWNKVKNMDMSLKMYFLENKKNNQKCIHKIFDKMSYRKLFTIIFINRGSYKRSSSEKAKSK